MPFRCVDIVNGDNSNDGRGWWRLAFTNGSNQPQIDDLITGATSGASGYVQDILVTSGSWQNGNAVGNIYIYGKQGTFTSETIRVGSTTIAQVSGDAIYNAKKTINNAIQGQNYDIYLAKTQAPRNTGLSATFTNNGGITLTSSVNQVILEPEGTSGWTSAQGGNVTFTNDTSNKIVGTSSIRINVGSGATVGRLAYYTFPSALNLSSYRTICFWVFGSAAVTGERFRLTLCSDTAGQTIVNTAPIGNLVANVWQRVVVETAGLGSSIQSIGIYMDTQTTVNINIDGIFACLGRDENGYIGLDTLVSKSSAEYGGEEMWYPVRYAVGTSIIIDGFDKSTTYNYYGTSETTTLYARNVERHSVNATTTTTPIEDIPYTNTRIYGGWSPVTNTQEGMTLIRTNGETAGYMFNSANQNITISRVGLLGGRSLLYGSGSMVTENCSAFVGERIFFFIGSTDLTAGLDHCYGVNDIINDMTVSNLKFKILRSLQVSNGIWTQSSNVEVEARMEYNRFGYNMINVQYGNLIIKDSYIRLSFVGNNLVFSNASVYIYDTQIINDTTSGASISYVGQCPMILYNTLIGGTSTVEFTGNNSTDYPAIISELHDQTADNHRLWWFLAGTLRGVGAAETGIRHTNSGYAWRLDSMNILATKPLRLELGRVYLTGSKTVKLWVRRSDVNIYGRLVVRRNKSRGITEDLTATTQGSANSWEELSVQVSGSGYIKIDFEFWGASGTNIIIDDLEVV